MTIDVEPRSTAAVPAAPRRRWAHALKTALPLTLVALVAAFIPLIANYQPFHADGGAGGATLEGPGASIERDIERIDTFGSLPAVVYKIRTRPGQRVITTFTLNFSGPVGATFVGLAPAKGNELRMSGSTCCSFDAGVPFAPQALNGRQDSRTFFLVTQVPACAANERLVEGDPNHYFSFDTVTVKYRVFGVPRRDVVRLNTRVVLWPRAYCREQA